MRSRWIHRLLLLLAAQLLAGCCRADTGAPVDAVAGAVATWLATKRGFRLRRKQGDPVDRAMSDDEFQLERHKASFAFHRARVWAERDASLREEPDYVTIKARVEAEFDQVEAVVGSLVGTPEVRGRFYGAPDPKEPSHLEIGELSTHVYRDDPPGITIAEALAANPPDERQAVVLGELDKRRRRAVGVLWRAAGIDEDVWRAQNDAGDELVHDDLVELLDRRLRSVEMLDYRASVGATRDGIGSSFIRRRFDPANRQWVWYDAGLLETLVNCSWTDDLERNFESPSLPVDVLDDLFHQRFVVSNPEPRFAPVEFEPLPRPWYRNATTGELDWNEWPGTQVLPLLVDPSWTGHPRALPRDQQLWIIPEPFEPFSGEPPKYAWVPAPGLEPSSVVRALFNVSTNWWERSWLHPNGVLAAILFEALLLARRRRDGNDEAFDAFGGRYVLALDDYFGLRGYKRVEDAAMQPGRTDYFENAPVDLERLQIGDQVLFESSLLVFVLAAWWDYPTVLITDIDTRADDQGVNLKRLLVQGFGSAEQPYAHYRRLLARVVDETLTGVQNHIEEKIIEPPPQDPPPLFPWRRPTSLAWDIGDPRTGEDVLQVWDPYPQQWDDPGPWWLRIYLDDPIWKGAFGDDVEAALKQLPRSVALIEPGTLLVRDAEEVRRVAVRSGFEVPPISDSVPDRYIFVPLYEPAVEVESGFVAGWYAFFVLQGQREFPPTLRRVRVDAEWLPGFAMENGKVRAIRPRCLRHEG